MTVTQEIRNGFATLTSTGVIDITELPSDYPAFIIRIPDGYGVAISVSNDMNVREHFNSCMFYTSTITVEGVPSNYLILSSAFEEYRNEFASFCTEFVDPGETGEKRTQILKNPLVWWHTWKELVGNTNAERKAYCVVAELCALESIYCRDHTAQWSASRMGSQDIECDGKSYEVKSTLKRYGAEIKISGQFQLSHSKPLFLYFCRMEESPNGISINEMKERLINIGYDSIMLETELQRQGFEYGASIRDTKYKILERRKYCVDESFPSITRESFKENCFPSGITHIEYTVDLDAVDYTIWD